MGVGWLRQWVPPPPRIKLRDLGSRRMETEACSSPRHCVKAEGAPRRRVLRDQCGRGGRVESAIVCYLPPPPPRFYSSLSGKESRNPGREPERNT